MAELYSLGRAYGLSVWSATQLASDYTSTPEGDRALQNAGTVLTFDGTRGTCQLRTPKGTTRMTIAPSPLTLSLMGGPSSPAAVLR